MFEKAKDFCKKHKKAIIIIAGGVVTVTVGALFGKKLLDAFNRDGSALESVLDNSADRALLEGFGAVFEEGYDVPFATKEVAIKFMEEMGDNYQIDILGPDTSVVWVTKAVN
jgi:hypothetical protein